VLDESQLEGTAMREVDVEGEPVLVTRSASGELRAIANTCRKVRGGPAVFPQPQFESRTRNGKIEVRRAPAG
jgi:hypothetical protein